MSAQRFGHLLRTTRHESGISQRALAETVGVDHTYLSKIEAGRMMPSADLTERLARALHASPLDFWRAAENTPPWKVREDERECCAREVEFLRDSLEDCAARRHLDAAADALRWGSLRHIHRREPS